MISTFPYSKEKLAKLRLHYRILFYCIIVIGLIFVLTFFFVHTRNTRYLYLTLSLIFGVLFAFAALSVFLGPILTLRSYQRVYKELEHFHQTEIAYFDHVEDKIHIENHLPFKKIVFLDENGSPMEFYIFARTNITLKKGTKLEAERTNKIVTSFRILDE